MVSAVIAVTHSDLEREVGSEALTTERATVRPTASQALLRALTMP